MTMRAQTTGFRLEGWPPLGIYCRDKSGALHVDKGLAYEEDSFRTQTMLKWNGAAVRRRRFFLIITFVGNRRRAQIHARAAALFRILISAGVLTEFGDHCLSAYRVQTRQGKVERVEIAFRPVRIPRRK